MTVIAYRNELIAFYQRRGYRRTGISKKMNKRLRSMDRLYVFFCKLIQLVSDGAYGGSHLANKGGRMCRRRRYIVRVIQYYQNRGIHYFPSPVGRNKPLRGQQEPAFRQTLPPKFAGNGYHEQDLTHFGVESATF